MAKKKLARKKLRLKASKQRYPLTMAGVKRLVRAVVRAARRGRKIVLRKVR